MTTNTNILLTAMTAVALSVALVFYAVILTGQAGATGSATFTSSAQIQDDAPVVQTEGGLTLQGVTSATTDVYLYFNATDNNGAASINDSSPFVRLNKSGESDLTNVSCSVSTINSTSKTYNCTVQLAYYITPGLWTINASVADNSGQRVSDKTKTATVANVDSVAVTEGAMSWSGLTAGTDNNAATQNPQRVNNTGNQNYASINLTGFSFTTGSNVLGVGNVTVNVTGTAAGVGQVLVNNTPVIIDSATLNRGATSLQNMSFWLDIPMAQASGTYNAQASWSVMAIQ